MKDLIVIIPIHTVNDDVTKLLPDAIKSVPSDLEVRLSCPNGLGKEISPIVKDFGNTVIYESKDVNETSFCALVNQAVGDSKYFSIVEFDDECTPIWYDNFKRYADTYPDVSVFMYLEDIVDYKEQKYIGFGNEAPWASSFSNEIGEIDNDCLQEFFDFYLTGSIFKTDDWKAVGGLKTNLPVVFWYEFLLRMTNKQSRIMVIPKVGYVHYLGRDGSLTETYRNTVTDKEGEYWFKVAKKESFHTKQRDVKPFNEGGEDNDD